MKEYARSFYLSQLWKKTQASYMQQQNYICERCGEPAKVVHHKKRITPQNINDVNITLNRNNLEALCQDCHNKEHHKKNNLRYMFDDNGNILPPIQKKF